VTTLGVGRRPGAASIGAMNGIKKGLSALIIEALHLIKRQTDLESATRRPVDTISVEDVERLASSLSQLKNAVSTKALSGTP